MSRLLPLLMLIVPLLLTAVAVIGTIASAVRWGFRIAVALGAALLARLLLPAQVAGGWAPLLIFAAVLVLLWLRARRKRRARPRAGPITIDQPAAPERAAPEIGPAWRELRGLADWRTRRRLDAAADACARYLQAAEAQEDPSAQLPIKLRKHLPAIVADCVRHSRTATPDERRALVADTLATLESLADRAEERRRELAHVAQGEFRARRAHLDRPDD